jgi:hypothetical protein
MKKETEKLIEYLNRIAKTLETVGCPMMAEVVIKSADEIIRLKNVSQPYMWVGSDPFTEQDVLDLLNENDNLRGKLESLNALISKRSLENRT